MKIITLKTGRENNVIDEVLDTLKNGGLVVSPSDTVYGLLVDVTNKQAVEKLIAFKNRPAGMPISIFAADMTMLKQYAKAGKNQEKVIEQLLPGPFTVILDSTHKVDKRLESEKGTIGVRIPDYRFILSLISKYGKAVTATSANLSGRSPHYRISFFLQELSKAKKSLLDLIVDAGTLPKNKPSTVIDLTKPDIEIIRQGDIVTTGGETFTTETPTQTKMAARYILKKILKKNSHKPLVFIIEGELGVGKTVFTKGLGEYLGISDIVSPSFVIYYDYDISHPIFRKFIHIDLYNIQEKEEFKHLGIEDYLKKDSILVFEWGEKAGEIISLLKSKTKIIYVKMEYVDKKKRRIIVNY